MNILYNDTRRPGVFSLIQDFVLRLHDKIYSMVWISHEAERLQLCYNQGYNFYGQALEPISDTQLA